MELHTVVPFIDHRLPILHLILHLLLQPSQLTNAAYIYVLSKSSRASFSLFTDSKEACTGTQNVYSAMIRSLRPEKLNKSPAHRNNRSTQT